jgi:hypothetical protein
MIKVALHWSWHIFLVLAVLTACTAVFLNFQSVDDQPLIKARQHLLFFGSLAISAGCLILWLLREMISNDWYVSMSRDIPHDPVLMAHIGPGSFPSSLQKALWCVLVLWASWVSWSLIIDDRLAAQFTIENGLLQDVTVVFYVVATFFFSSILLRILATGFQNGLAKWWFLLLCVGCIGVAGEETNWGQSVLPYATPDFLVHTNIQREVSLHNIELPGLSGRHWSNAALWGISLIGGVIIPLLLVLSESARRLAIVLDLPIPPWMSQAYFLVGTLIPQDGVLLGSLSRDNIPSELREVTVAIAMMVWGWAWWRRRTTKSSDFQHHTHLDGEHDGTRTLPI